MKKQRKTIEHRSLPTINPQMRGGHTMKKIIVSSVLGMFSLFIMMSGVSGAQVPKKINYQGYLMDSSGTPINETK